MALFQNRGFYGCPIVYSGQQRDGEGTLMLGKLAHRELAKADEERCPVFGFVVKEEAWEMGIEIP